MGQTTVLERRHSIRRAGGRRGGPVDESAVVSGSGRERRKGRERREYLAQHHITVGRVAGSGGWMGGVCSCGEHTLSRVDGLIEAWARWHRREVMTHRASFVHSS